ncbi:MAG: phage holin [Oscillospiraceae bacterium]
MKINWSVRLKNKTFWISLIPAILLLLQVGGSILGFNLDFGDLGNKLLTLVNAVFSVLVILGVVVDPTTAGIGDSTQALTYRNPKERGE